MFELAPYRGFGSLERLRKEMDNLLGRFWEGPERILGEGVGAFVPSINIKETDNTFEVSAETPGMKPEDIEVSLTGDMLTIKGEKKEEKEETKGDYRLVERRFGSFQRSFRLPSEVDSGKLKASHKDGVLKISLPKSKKSAATKIAIEKG